jgi:hypothetical protein
MKKLVCEHCKRGFTTQSGLTLHQKACQPKGNGKKPPKTKKPENGDTPQEDDYTLLTATDRQHFFRLINRRQDTILKALNDEMQGGKEDVVYDMIRREKGMVFSTDQLKDLISSIDEQIKAELEKRMSKERRRLEVKRSEVVEDFEEQEEELKKRHREEYRVLRDSKKAAQAKIREELSNIEEAVTKEHAGPLLQKKMEYQSQLAQAKQVEMEVQALGNQRLAVIRQSKGRLEHTIRDAAGRALEMLTMQAMTRSEAKNLLEKIPTVAEAIKLCSSPEGIEEFFRMLDPNMPKPALPPPPSAVEVDAEVAETVKVAVMANSEEDEEEDFEELNTDREWEVYRNRD